MNDELKELTGRAMHIAYEAAAIECGWSTQDSCKASYDDLPAKNRFCMDASVEAAAEVIATHIDTQADEIEKRSEDRGLVWFCTEYRIIAEQLRP